ncbi:DNA polymerase III subunit alpha [Thermotoga sp. KOL6]|uniref:helix-hairpin-helix domain-containing protein n=1 Tax=Thermotoga sp. KOL6 TaxID=126741 RepID=UPI000C775ADD|nr:DNA polymerase III subunit alpha [Thermotoga sp. KOL6]PLV59188.1 DNA polymerase III subunit alpha [Thermotoga sp. KOL6]
MIPWVISPYSFDGSVVRIEKLITLLKEMRLKSVLLADRNFHIAVKFNTLMRKHDLIPVHGLWKEERVFVARNREEYDLLVKFYNGEEKADNLLSFQITDLVPVRYLDPTEREASIFMRKVFGLDENVRGFPKRCEDIAKIVKAEAYDLKVDQKLPIPPEDWYISLERKAKELGTKYVERLKREYDLMEKKGFVPYVYTVERLVEIAKRMGIKVGPGRGSAVGSLMVYLCGITEVDPLKHNLLFERFMNEERDEPPDIDIDVEDRKRKELISELAREFHVYQISTFGNLTERSLRNLINSFPLDSEQKTLIYKTVYGLPHHRSIHAAGIVISETPLTLPMRLEEGTPVTDYDMHSLENVGVVKMDILGLKTLSFIKDLEKGKIDYSDEKTYRTISRGKTLGIFQLEGFQARKLCRKISPKKLEDLSILLALNRPGPLKSGIDSAYTSPKNVPQLFKEIFPETKGVVIFQEQIMSLAMFAGLSGSESDTLRKAIAKKEREIMIPLLEKMREGLIKKGVQDVDFILNILLNFSSYAFNKSHSVAYAHITFQTAYLKTHFFEEFFKKYFEYNIGDSEKIFLAVQELRSEDYKVHPPDVNISGESLIIENKEVYLPLTAVKGVGISLIKEIEKVRPIKSVRDLQERVPRNILENMIAAGAFDNLYENRAEAFDDLNKRVDRDILEIRELFGEKIDRSAPKMKVSDVNELERKSLGFPLTLNYEVPVGLFGNIPDVFTYGKVLPVVVRRVTRGIVTDGVSICQLLNDIPDGLFLILLSPFRKSLRIWPFNENMRFLYKVNSPVKLERAGKNEITQVGTKIYEGYRPVSDEYEYKIIQ